MSTRQLLEIVKERGLKIVLDGDKPILKRPNGNEGVTDKLLACLKRHRENIIAILKK
jgi:hypothetical protein